jgi:hypothetical protein
LLRRFSSSECFSKPRFLWLKSENYLQKSFKKIKPRWTVGKSGVFDRGRRRPSKNVPVGVSGCWKLAENGTGPVFGGHHSPKLNCCFPHKLIEFSAGNELTNTSVKKAKRNGDSSKPTFKWNK